MGKAPASQFYWADWMNDVELQKASASSRGIWINALCRMWFSRVKGELSGDQNQLIQLLNCTAQEFNLFMSEIETLNFGYSVRKTLGSQNPNDDINAIITLRNRRMYREGMSQEQNRLRQKRFYEKHQPNAEPNASSNADITPLSSSSSSSSNNNNCPQNEIVDLFHRLLPGLPKVREWDEARQELLRARWRENPERQNLEWWEHFFTYIKTCPFLMGEVDPAPDHKRFWLKLPWALKKANFLKIIEGDYEGKA